MAAHDTDHPDIRVVLRFGAGVELTPQLRQDLDSVLPEQIARISGGASVQALMDDFAKRVGSLFTSETVVSALAGARYREISVALMPNENMNASCELPRSLVQLAATHGIDIYISAL